MSSVTKSYCDRCGKELVLTCNQISTMRSRRRSTKEEIKLFLSSPMFYLPELKEYTDNSEITICGTLTTSKYDLCNKCSAELKEWLKKGKSL